MEPVFDMEPNQDAAASEIFNIFYNFICITEKHKQNSELANFPEKIKYIPWRRVYKILIAGSINYQNKNHWDPTELSFGGTGTLWCFTKLERSGENVSRKTEDGQTWSGKSGRLPKKGYPQEILVAKLVINSQEFHMLEFTLKKENKPTVALCKIWRTGSSTVASPETPCPNVSGPGASTPQQVLDDHFVIHEGVMDMQIDEPKGQQKGIAQQHVPSFELSVSGYILIGDSSGGSFQSNGQNDNNSTYQDSVSFLSDTKESFRKVCLLNGVEAHLIASSAQKLASYLRNVLNNLGIGGDEQSNGASTSYSTQLMEGEAVDVTAPNPAALAPEPVTATQDDFQFPELDPILESGFFFVDNDQ